MATLRDKARQAVLVAGVAVAVGLVGASHPEPVAAPWACPTSVEAIGIEAPSSGEVLERLAQAATELGEHLGDKADERRDDKEQAEILAEDRSWRLVHQIVRD